MNRDNNEPLSRRDFVLKIGAATAGACALGALRPSLEALAADPFLIIINLKGGNDGLNTVVPVTLTQYAKRRPTIAIPPTEVLDMTQGPYGTDLFGLHPSLTNLATRWTAGELAVVQKVGYPRPNLSHFSSTEIWSRGTRSLDALGGRSSGWIARYKDLHAPDPLHVIGLGTRKRLDFLGGKTASTILGSLADLGFARDPRYKAGSQFRDQIVLDVLSAFEGPGVTMPVRETLSQAYGMVGRLKDALNSYQSTVSYPTTSLGKRLQEAAILVYAGMPTRIYYTATSGYDTHSGQGAGTGRHASLLNTLDDAVGALAQDLQAMGAWRRTAIVVLSEFGRRNYENGSKGTDHGSGSVMFVTGGAIRGGIYGSSLTDADLLQRHLPYDVDFRSAFKELIEKHLGADPSRVFPEKQDRAHRLGFVV